MRTLIIILIMSCCMVYIQASASPTPTLNVVSENNADLYLSSDEPVAESVKPLLFNGLLKDEPMVDDIPFLTESIVSGYEEIHSLKDAFNNLEAEQEVDDIPFNTAIIASEAL